MSFKAYACAGLLLVLSSGPSLAFGVNKSIKIGAGEESGSQSTVNGSISVGNQAVVDGSLETVNGTIRIDDDVRLTDASTVNGSIRIGSGVSAIDVESVNGSIRIGDNVVIDGEVSVVNGKITIGQGSSVADGVSNVNGELRIVGSDIGGDMTTVNGDVWLTDNATLRGNLVVEKPGGWGWGRKRNKPKVVIGPGARVLGTIEAEHAIELYVSESATIGRVTGEIDENDIVRFSGARP